MGKGNCYPKLNKNSPYKAAYMKSSPSSKSSAHGSKLFRASYKTKSKSIVQRGQTGVLLGKYFLFNYRRKDEFARFG